MKTIHKIWQICLIQGMAADLGYDCLIIPGAAEGPTCNALGAAGSRVNANRFCGQSAGLAKTAAAKQASDAGKLKQGTICSKYLINSFHNYRTWHNQYFFPYG